jgi:DNA-binding SARP family transcriptional activator
MRSEEVRLSVGPSRSELLLLGRPCLLVGGVEVEVPTRKGLGLLAYLALEGRTSREQAASVLWSEWPGPDARRNLRQELYRLQRSSAAQLLVTGAATLELAPGVEVDALSFREELAAGAIDAALARWRGPLLHGLEVESPLFEEWAERRRATYGELHLGALARRAMMLEAAGHLREALRAALDLLAENELDEANQRAAMRLHYRLGEREAALLRYQRYTRLLRDELDVDPLPETVRLAGRIRASAAMESPPAPDRPRAVRLDPPLVEREEAWRALEAAQALALVFGEPGAGKTRLAMEFAAAHPPVLVIRGQEISTGTPLFPFAVAIREALETPGRRRAIEGLDALWRREAARLVPELSEEEPGPADPEGRATFLEGLARVMTAAVGGGTLVLDDLQAFDATSVELLAHLARRDGPFRLVAVARSDGLGGGTPLDRTLERLRRDGRLTRVGVSDLSASGVRALVRTLSGTDATLFSARLHRATGGNPLFLLETLHALFAAGQLWVDAGGAWSTPYDEATSDYAELPVPETVRGAVLERIDRLGPAVRRLLEAASLAGERFTAEALAGATALSDWETLEAMERLQAAQLVVPDAELPAPSPARPRAHLFAHELVRRSLSEGLSVERRRLLHGKLAEGLVARRGPPQEIAQHLERAGRRGEARALRLRAAESAVRVYAHGEALLHYQAALDDGPDEATAFDIHSARVELLRYIDDAGERLRALEAMAVLAGSLDDPARWAQLAVKQSIHHHETDRLDLALEVCEQALERLGARLAPSDRAALALEAGAALAMMGRCPEAEARLLDVLSATSHAAPLKHANACYWLAHCERQRGDGAAATAHLDAAIAGTESVGHRRGHAMALRARAGLRLDVGDLAGGVADLEAAWSEIRAIGNLDLQRGLAEELRALLPRLDAPSRERVEGWLSEPEATRSWDQGAVVKVAGSAMPTEASASRPASPSPRSGAA